MYEAELAIVEASKIINSVAEHDHSVKAHSKGESVPFAGIVSTGGQDIGMDHAAWDDLNPPGVLTHTASLPIAKNTDDVEIETGFNKGVECRPEAGFYFPPHQAFNQSFQGGLQVPKGHVAIDKQTFDLVETSEMSGIDCFISKAFSRCNDSQRWLTGLQGSNLNGACVGPGNLSRTQVEGVPDIPSRVVFGMLRALCDSRRGGPTRGEGVCKRWGL